MPSREPRAWRVLGGVVASVCFALVPRDGAAHPHVFVDYAVVLTVAADGSLGAQVTWTYDEMFSSLILENVGPKRGPALSPADVAAIERKQFEPLKAYQYFLDIRVDGQPLRVTSVRDFRASVEGERVTYIFTVPIPVRNPREGSIQIRVDDPTYFVAFDARAQRPIAWSAPPTYAVACRLRGSGGSYEAPAIDCTYRRKGP